MEDALSPKSQNQEVVAEGDVSRRRTACPATGLGGSTSKVMVGADAARVSQAAAIANARMPVRRKSFKRVCLDGKAGAAAAAAPDCDCL